MSDTNQPQTMNNDFLEIAFEGFFLARLATDPDPSFEERGISGFTYAGAGEDLLDPSVFFQSEDVLEAYGYKKPAYTPHWPPSEKDYTPDTGDGATLQPSEEDKNDVQSASDDDLPLDYTSSFDVKNIRDASPDYERYRQSGIGVRVTEVRIGGQVQGELTERFRNWDVRVRVTNAGVPGAEARKGPTFEGRNQIVSDGDPDRFTLNPFVFQLLRYHRETTPPGAHPKFKREVLLQRFDPLDPAKPYEPLYKIVNNEVYLKRWPSQRFANSAILLQQLGIEDPVQHFTNRAQWLQGKIASAQAEGRQALAQLYESRLYAVNFFTQATGPTVMENRLASRIPLRQLYSHPIRGTNAMQPPIIVDTTAFKTSMGQVKIDTTKNWEVLYYLGAYDGDLMAGFMNGVITLPLLP